MKNKLCMLLLASGIGLFSCAEQDLPKEYTDSVNVFIGTGGHGHTFPGATLPHGMVQLSPDTRLFGWDACSGYYYDDTSIMGFTHTHLSGTGIGDYGDILFMPVVGEKPLIAGTAENPDEGYRSRFSHEQESARPGYYQVLLQDDSINVELTATLRAGLHRYTYPKASDARLIVDMEPTIHGHQHPVTQIRVVNDSTIAGMKYTVGWAKRHYVYFYAVFSSPFDYKLYSGTEYQPDSTSVTVNTAKAVMSFRNLPADGRVLAKVGISSVDEEGARLNVEAEIPNWDFEGVMKQANTAWNEALGKIDIETSDNDSRTVFYTSLYHAFIQPSLASDVDGRYRTMGHEIKQDVSYTNYTVFSLWDTFRAAHPLYTIVTPEQNQAFIRSLLRKYDEGGILPKWELASNETGTMIGYHAVSVIADAMMKKQCDFDVKKALEACIRSSVYDTTGVTPMMDRQILNGKLMPVSIKYKNEIKHLYYEYENVLNAQGEVIGTKERDDISNKWFIGQPIGAIWDYKVTGIWQKDEVEEAAKYGQRPGDPKVWNNPDNDKVNADGSVTIVYDNDDKQFLGQSSPKVNWSMRNEFTFFKDLTFSFNIYSKMGHKSLETDYLNKDNAGSKVTNGQNVYAKKGYWTVDNPTNEYGRLDAQGPSGVTTPGKLHNRSFIRLDNISLAYKLPKKFISRWSIEKAIISGSIKNVAVWAKDWKYWDPETGGLAPRTFNIGLTLTL